MSDAPPETSPANPVELPSSALVVRASVSEQQLLDELAKQIPQTLAHEKRRPIGAPGDVTYTVTRGAMASSLGDDQFRVTTLANAQIEVCKPLGPFCVTYGRCQPVLATTVAMPLLLTEDYAWRTPATSVRAERGCRIAGFDVTSRLTSIARSNLGTVRERIERSLPPVKPWATRLWELTTNPLFLDSEHCLRMEPRRFVQTKPRASAGGYHFSVALELALEITGDCRDQRQAPPLAPLATESKLAEPASLRLAQHIDTTDLSSQLEKSAVGRFADGERVRAISVSTIRREDQNQLLLGVKLDGATCGTTWLSAELEPSPEAALTLSNVRFVGPNPAPALAGLPGHLAKGSALRPPLAFGAAAERLAQLVETLTSLSETPVQISVSLGPPKTSQALIDAEGAYAIATTPLDVLITLAAAEEQPKRGR